MTTRKPAKARKASAAKRTVKAKTATAAAKRTTRAAPKKAPAKAKSARKAPAKAVRKAPAKARAVRKPAAAKSAAAVKLSATPAGTSDKDHLISVIQGSTGSTAKAAKATLDNVIATITASLKKNQKVQLTGFGTLVVTKRAARMGRNPRTGEKVRIKASKSVRFRAGKTLKDSV